MNGPRTIQQREIMQELARREDDARGAQRARDFAGFRVTNEFSTLGQKYAITESGAKSVFERLCKRQVPLVESIGTRPRRYRLTAAGRESIA